MAMEIFQLVGRIVYQGQRQIENGLNNLQDQIEQTQGKLKQFGETASNIGEKTKSIGAGFSQYVSAPLLAIGTAGFIAANSMDQALGKIAAQTDRTTKDTNELKKAAQDLWKNAYGEDINAAAEAITIVDRNMGNLVDNTTEVKDLAENAFILQDVFGYDMQESTKAAAALMKNFGVTGDDAFDMITTAAQRGGDYSGELIDSISEYSTQYANMGFSGAQMMNMFATASENGLFSLDKVGDAVKESFLQITDGADNTKAAMGELGLNYDQINKDIQAGGPNANAAFGVVMTAISKVTDEADRNRLAVELMGTPIEDLGPQYQAFFATAGEEMKGFTGSTEQAGKEIYDNIGVRAVAAWRAFQAALLPIGAILINIVEPAIAKLQTGIEKLANWFGSLTADQQKFIVILGIAAAAIGPLLVVIGTLISSIGAIATFIGTVSAVTFGWVAAIAVIGAALVALYLKFEPFRTIVNSVFQAALSIIRTVLTTIVNFVRSQLNVLAQFWQQNGTQIMQAVTNAFNIIKSIISFVMPAVLAIVKFAWTNIKNVIQGALNIIMGLVRIFTGIFTGDFSQLWAGVKSIFKGAIQLVIGLMNLTFLGGIKKIILNLSRSAISSIKTMASSIVGFFRGLAGNAGRVVSGMVSNVLRFFTNLLTRARTIFNTVRTFTGSVFQAIRSTITNSASSIYSAFTSRISSMASRVKSAFSGILSTARSIFNSVKNAITNPIETARSTITSAISRIKSAFSNMKVKIPMPHFNFSSGTKKVAGVSIPYPKVSVDWYKEGAVFGSPSIIGVGEEKGVKEAVIPLKTSVLSRIGAGIAAATQTAQRIGAYSQGAAQTATAGPMYNHVHVYIGNEEIVDYIEPAISERQGDQVNNKGRLKGDKI